jgi:N-acylneuraminate cytidylyltransferase
MFWPENENARSQDLEKAYHDTGLFYWYKSDFFLNNSENSFNNCGGIIYEEHEVQDIDTMNDWKIAEMKYKLLES